MKIVRILLIDQSAEKYVLQTALTPKKVPPNPDSLTATTDKRGCIINWLVQVILMKCTLHKFGGQRQYEQMQLVATVEGTRYRSNCKADLMIISTGYVTLLFLQVTGFRSTNKKTFSAYHPTDANAGVSATSLDNRGEKGTEGAKGEIVKGQRR